MFSEDDLLPLSGLQHLAFCERQAALIHVEQVWLDNVWTVEGQHLHETTDEGQGESRREVRVARGLPLRSLTLGLSGRADVVEFHRVDDAEGGTVLTGFPGRWRPFPIEYKRGRPKRHRADEIQVCAEALCLEEMLETPVPAGALFYGKTRRRTGVTFDDDLRAEVTKAASRFRALIDSRRTPPAEYGPKCEECSLMPICAPRSSGKRTARHLYALLHPPPEVETSG